MQGKTVVITGATSGIGAVAATTLARQGAKIVFIARDRARGEQVLQQLRAISPGAGHLLHRADLSLMSEMKRVAAAIAFSEKKIDVLVNNAGALFSSREVTSEGLEMTFATNHMAYFVVTAVLLERLKATPGARIVSTASDAYKSARLNFKDLQSSRGYGGFGMYGRSKLMNVLFTRLLARRLAGTGVTANCHHPGFVATRFGDSGSGFMNFLLQTSKRFALTPEQGAQTMLYLAASPAVAKVSGTYFYKCKPTKLMRQARNDADAQRLWDISAELSGVGA
jgi:NAD(P)-dependent dehydrogenase (short-subunit alcohol dehydrogenase family)